MKTHLPTHAGRYILTVIFAVLFLAAERRINCHFIYRPVGYAVIFPILALAAASVLAACRDFRACGVFVAVICLVPLAETVWVCLTHPNVFPSEETAMGISMNWAGVIFICTVAVFLFPKKRAENFHSFFLAASVVFFPVYLFALGIALFFDMFRRFTMAHRIREFNLIPLVKTIMPYVAGTAHTNSYTPIINMASNLLLFVPVGFYLAVLYKKKNAAVRSAVIVGVPVLVELSQYLLAAGISDIDDVIVNSLGGLLGSLLCFGLEKAYRLRKQDDGAVLFSFRR